MPTENNVLVGTADVSRVQLSLLEEARRESGLSLFQSLDRVVNDGDINHGKENLHPDWIELFEKAKGELRRMVPGEYFERFDKFFGELNRIDRTIGDIKFKTTTAAFLLGAGASKPAPSSIPTVKELLPELVARARRLDREDLNQLADFCEQSRIDNIEDLLTAAQLATFTSRNPVVQRLVNFLLYRQDRDDSEVSRRRRFEVGDQSAVAFLQDTLQVLFGLLSSTMLPAQPNPAHKAIAGYVKEHGGSIITTNYDCCMDLALDDEKAKFSYGLGFTNPTCKDGGANTEKINLIKLHGSLNWFYCETCQEVQQTNIRSTVKNFMEDIEPYPVIAICKGCGGQRRGLLVPPLAMKFDVAPPLLPLTAHAASAFECAGIIVVVGFSFADADMHITRMVSKSLQRSANQKLVVVDPSPQVVQKLRRKFRASIPNFDPKRIVQVCGDSSLLLPKLLSDDLVHQEQPINPDATVQARVRKKP